VTTYLYDLDDNRVGLIDPDGNRTTFVYDALNRQTQETDPLNHVATFAYDALDHPTSATDRDGRVRNFNYDTLGRLSTTVWLDSGGHVVNTLTYTYDADNNLLTAGDVNGTYTMSYDALNREITVQEPFGLSLTYTYDPDNNRTLVQDSLGGVTTSVYDAANELISRQFDGTGQTPLRYDMNYDARGLLATETRFSDLAGMHAVGTSSYTYNGDGQVTHLLQQDGSGNTLANYTYTYDLADRVLTETLNGTTTSYTYDNTNQLIGATSPIITTTYSYDANGNRTNPGYSTDGANELLSDGIWNFSYDAEGNLTGKAGISNGLSWTYTYDNLNRLTSAQEFSGATVLETVSYKYDVFGNRIEEDVTPGAGPAAVTRFAYDGQDAWADLDGSNHLLTRRLYLDAVDQLVARISASGTVAWYLTDRLGSVRDLTDASGALLDQITYDAYGNVVIETNAAAGDRYKYTGREFDAATGLQYNRARYYDPTIGRWTSQDPLGFDAGDPNLYRYVRNDPTNATDPSGLIITPPKPEPPIFSRPPGRPLDQDRIALILKELELCGLREKYPRPNAIQKELIDITKIKVTHIQNTIREKDKLKGLNDPAKKRERMEVLINLDTLKKREKQLDDRAAELKKQLNK
jgi:RHS repeat-associated protein